MPASNVVLMDLARRAGKPVIFWGPPGVGKTSALLAYAAAAKLYMAVVIASVREPADFAGLPVIKHDPTTNVWLAPPGWATELCEAGGGILFLDEISTAPPATQAALLRVVLDRVVGDVKLPDTVWIVGAANRAEDNCGTWDLSAALANRFTHIDWVLDSADWCDGMLTRFGAGFTDEVQAAVYAQVVSFIRVRGSLLHKMPEAASETGRAWASPRSWHSAADLLTVCLQQGYDRQSTEVAALMVGTIGAGCAGEFLGWLRDQDLPDPESWLANPEHCALPVRDDRLLSALDSLATAALREHTDRKARYHAAWKVILRVYDKRQDAVVPASKALVRGAPAGLVPPRELATLKPLIDAARIK